MADVNLDPIWLDPLSKRDTEQKQIHLSALPNTNSMPFL